MAGSGSFPIIDCNMVNVYMYYKSSQSRVQQNLVLLLLISSMCIVILFLARPSVSFVMKR